MIRRPPRDTRTHTLCPYTTLYRSDEDDVIAAVVLECGAALETGCAAGQQRQRADAGIQFQSRELVGAACCESARQRFLSGRQPVHGPMRRLLDRRSTERRVRNELVSTCCSRW